MNVNITLDFQNIATALLMAGVVWLIRSNIRAQAALFGSDGKNGIKGRVAKLEEGHSEVIDVVHGIDIKVERLTTKFDSFCDDKTNKN